MSVFNRNRVLNSDDDSDFGSRYNKPSSSYSQSHSNHGLSSARSRENFSSRDNFNSRDNFSSRDNFNTRDNFSSRDNFTRDNFTRDSRDLRDNEKPSGYGSYRNKFDNDRNSKFDSSDDDIKSSNNRYGANSRRTIRHSSESDSDDNKNSFDRRRGTNTNLRTRPSSSISRKDSLDIDTYEGANQKLKMMIQWDKSLCEQLDDLYETKTAKEKKIEQLKEEIHRDTIKEDGLRKKLSELRMNRKVLQSRLDEYK